MSKPVGVLGLGSWGTALAYHLSHNGSKVIAWTRRQDLIDSILKKGIHPKLNLPVNFPSSFKATTNESELDEVETLVIAVPSRAFSAVVKNRDLNKHKIILSAAKGLVPEVQATPLSFLHEQHSQPQEKLAVLSGPSFASDLISHRPISVVIASKNVDVTKHVGELFAAPAFRVYTSNDPLGVELGGIVKNVLAIAAGVSDSLNFGPSARAGLITRGLSEMLRLAEALGVNPKTITGLSGLGDLIMTATDDQSRNRQIGLRLGRGETLEAALKSVGSEVEGISTAPLLLRLAGTHGVDMPITTQVSRLVQGSIDPRQLATELLSRPMRSEF